jgi:hypothetical protein
MCTTSGKGGTRIAVHAVGWQDGTGAFCLPSKSYASSCKFLRRPTCPRNFIANIAKPRLDATLSQSRGFVNVFTSKSCPRLVPERPLWTGQIDT